MAVIGKPKYYLSEERAVKVEREGEEELEQGWTEIVRIKRD